MKWLTAQPLTVNYSTKGVIDVKRRKKNFVTVYNFVNGCEHRTQHLKTIKHIKNIILQISCNFKQIKTKFTAFIKSVSL